MPSLLVKFGGSIAAGGDGDPVLRELAEMHADGMPIVLVHGGGPAVDTELRARQMLTRRIAGLRVTDAATLDVVQEVLGRRVNASIVAALITAGADARRIAGDDGLFIARRAEHPAGDLGFVGDIEAVEPHSVRAMMEAGALPVVSPIGSDRRGQRYNINADTAAGALAAVLAVDVYLVLTDVERVRIDRDDPASGIARMTLSEAQGYRERGVFVDGMLPKIDAAMLAVRGAARRAIIGGVASGSIAALLKGAGTEIVR